MYVHTRAYPHAHTKSSHNLPQARAKVVAEADAILQEVCGQLDGLVEATDAAGGDAQVRMWLALFFFVINAQEEKPSCLHKGTRTLTRACVHAYSIALTLTHTQTHAHAHTHTNTHTHAHAHAHIYLYSVYKPH
jgi:hypothetical protein